MTLLTVCQNVAREVGLAVPSTIIGNSDKIAARLLQHTQTTGKRLSRKHFSSLIEEHTFTTIANEDDYPLPTGPIVDGTVWNRSDSDPAFNATPEQWQEVKSGLVANVITDLYRVRSKQGILRLFLDETPSSVETFAFEYISGNWVVDRTGSVPAFKSSFTLDTDESIIDEFLLELSVLWRTLRRLGEPYFDERDEAEREIQIRLGQDKAAKTIRGRARGIPLVANVGEKGFGQ